MGQVLCQVGESHVDLVRHYLVTCQSYPMEIFNADSRDLRKEQSFSLYLKNIPD